VPASLPGRIGVWWFLASEIMVFGGLIASFVVFRLGGTGWHAEASHLSVPLAALNTLILLSSSLTMVQAFAAAEDGNARSARMFLWLTILCGLGFLGVKAVEYSREIHEGFVPGSGLFWSFYYAMTGLHALHLVAGIIVNLVMLGGGRYRMAHRLEAAGLYWHFVDIVWIFLFPLVYLT
jgi:cytochrome c oxidase subunit 3